MFFAGILLDSTGLEWKYLLISDAEFVLTAFARQSAALIELDYSNESY